ncbi:MAG TPA: hypothetical protein VK851_10860 [Anaerolineales bacterium]|nr:hypothetical protein [Anaerolineales bacterium]
MTGKQYVILLSGLATALLHLSLFPRMGPDPIALNGLGYLGLLGAYFLPISFFQQNHKLVWWALFGYTALTFILWVIMGDKTFALDFSNAAIGYYAKTAEVILLLSLWSDKPNS